MSVPFHRIVRNVAHRIGYLKGGNAAGIDVSFNTVPLTIADFQHGSFEAVKDAVLMAEEQLAEAIADTGEHPWRAYLASQTANVPHEGALPSTNSASKPIIGIWGAILDSTDATPCTEMPLDMVRRRATNSNTQFRLPVYWYNIVGRYLFHTRTNVVIEVCTYDAGTQRTAIDSNGNILLADVLEPAYVMGGLAFLGGEGSDSYKGAFSEQLATIRRGLSNVIGEVSTA